MRGPVRLHLLDGFPGCRTVKQTNISALSTNALRGLAISFGVGIEIILFTHYRSPGAVRGQNALETVTINIQVRDQGERRIVGVNAFVDEAEETTVPVLAVPPGSIERHLARLERTRRERDAGAVEATLRGLRDAASRAGTSDTNLMPHFVRCAEAYATLGEQCAVLRQVFGEYREPVAV